MAATYSELLKQYIIPCDLTLEPKEVCLYMSSAMMVKSISQQVQTKTKKSPGLGIGIPVTKHLGIGIGRRKVTTTTTVKPVMNKVNVMFYMTSRRILVKEGKKLFEIRARHIKSAKYYSDGIEIWHAGGHSIFTIHKKNMERLNQINSIINAAKSGGEQLRLED